MKVSNVCYLAALLWLTTTTSIAAQRFSFAAIGDNPYTFLADNDFDKLIDKLNDKDLAFVVHDGDFKASYLDCSDALFARRKAQFERSRHPFIYTPGDNEWTDCHKFSAGNYDPRERLKRLREMFFAAPQSLGQHTLKVERQSDTAEFKDYAENLRWRYGDVWFVTLNLPGSNNNFGRNDAMDAEYRARSRANAAWLRDAVRVAHDTQVIGLVLIFQADPLFSKGLTDPESGYRDLLRELAEAAKAFAKPMLIIHGDNHTYTLDRPLRDPATGKRVMNVQRLETFGAPTVDWVRVTVDPDTATIFRIAPGEP